MSKYPGRIVSNLAPAGYSVFFTGTSFLTVPAGTAFAPGTGNFTIEAWVYPTASGDRFIWTQTVSGTNYFTFGISTTTAALTMTASGGGTSILGPANSLVQNAWNHIAAVRSSGTVTVYVNGVGGTPTSNTLDLSNTTYTPTIGTYTHSTGFNVFAGYMSNLRYVKGTALYTANFAPPTQLFNVTNTSFLSFNSPAIIDQSTANSGSGFPIAVSGLSTVSTFTPFTAYVPYNPALGASTPGIWTVDEAMQAAATRQWNMYDPAFNLTTLLLHGNPTNGTSFITDASTNNFTVTPNGDVRAANLSPFSLTTFATSGSAYFDGTGDFVNLGGQSAFSFGTGDWTVEFWMNFTATGGTLFDTRPAGTASTNGFSVLFLSAGSVRYDTASGVKITGSTLSANTWYHVALSKASGVTRLFINGVQDGSSYTDSVNYGVGANRPIIGADGNSPTSVLFTGYLSNYRIVKGVGVYTGNFTTPTAPLTATQAAGTNISAITGTQTSLLTLQNSQSANNNAFLDSSSNNFLITRNGNTTQGSFSPFSQTGWSNYFVTSGDFLNSPHPSMNATWTIEAWIYRNSGGVNQSIVFMHNNGSINLFSGIIVFINTSNFLTVSDGVNAQPAFSNLAVPINAWTHIAVVRSGGTTTGYINGIVAGSNTFTPITVNSARIGYYFGSDPMQFPGYISNVRVVNGTAVYTSAFTPPTSPLTNITNTSLLTCQSNRFVDNSGTPSTITVNGTPSVQAFSPFYPTAAYTPQTIGGSGFFDGTGDFLTVANNAAFNFGSGNFCIETWFYPTAASQTTRALITLGSIATGNGAWLLWLNPSAFPAFYVTTGGTTATRTDLADNKIPPINSWVHIAVCRTSNTLSLFVNGSRVGTTAYSSTVFNDTTDALTFMVPSDGGTPTTGYLSGSRIIKGSSPYDATQTTIIVPAAPATNIANTSILLNYTNAGVVDSTGDNVLETIGNAQISTAVSRFGGSSIAFDGTGDYLVTPSSPVNILGSGDFTVELWAYPSNISAGYRALVASENYNGTTGGWSIYQNGTAIEVWLTGSGSPLINATSSLTATTWQHIALSRASGTVRLFVNGISVGSASSSAEWTGQRIFIGDNNVSGTDYFFNGYIDDLRITKGFARYTAAFTPQTSQWQDQ